MRQLSGVDTAFLAWEGPTTVGHVTGVVLLDPATSPVPWTFDRFRSHFSGRIVRLEPFTQKLVEVPLGLDRPYWITDTDFDLDYHLRYVAVPGDSGREAFADLVARIHERPLDRRRPLWECYVVDGVPPGQDAAGQERKAIIAKIHHAAIDGVSGQELLAQLVDLTPITEEPDDDGRSADIDGDEESIAAEPPPQTSELMTRAALSLLSSPARLARAGVTLAKVLPIVGPGFGRGGPVSRGDESTRELIRRFGAAPPTPFNATIGPHRRWAYTSIPLDAVKDIKNAASAGTSESADASTSGDASESAGDDVRRTTVNDVILAVVSGVLRGWLIDHDTLPDRPLAAMVPLSIARPDASGIGNAISSTVTTLATHIDDPAERLAAIRASMHVAKDRHEALPADLLTDLSQVAPPAVGALTARLIASTRMADRVSLPFNLVVSNVPGPPIPIYLAGAEIVGHYPVSAIIDGVGLNVTVQSTNGNLDFGYVSDRDLVDDLWTMADRTGEELDALYEAVVDD